MSAEDRIRNTIAAFCHTADAGDYAGWVDLFTEDGTYHLMGQTYSGRDELRSFIEIDQAPRNRGLHLTTDSLITMGVGTANAVSKFVFIGEGASGAVVVTGGTFRDLLVPRGDRWLFRDRATTLFAPAAPLDLWGTGKASGPHSA